MTTKERLDKHERQIQATAALVREGMRLVVATRKDIKTMHENLKTLHAEVQSITADIKSLAAAQKKTEASLKAFIDSMRVGGNGHAKGKVDLR